MSRQSDLIVFIIRVRCVYFKHLFSITILLYVRWNMNQLTSNAQIMSSNLDIIDEKNTISVFII